MWEAMGLEMGATLALAAGAFPVVAAIAFARLGSAHVWDAAQVYHKPDEYGEQKRWKGPIRTRFNAWTSLAYCEAGSYILHDIACRLLRPPQNCGDVYWHWHVMFGASLTWTGVASFLFHASLTERWRALDAGATMGVTFFPAALCIYRALRANGWEPYERACFALAVLGWAYCHRLAQTPGWSDAVLISNLVGQLILEWTALASYKEDYDTRAWTIYTCVMLFGVSLRACDVEVEKWRLKGWPSLGQRMTFLTSIAWLGHSAWHILTSAGIVVLVSRSTDIVEPFCVPPH